MAVGSREQSRFQHAKLIWKAVAVVTTVREDDHQPRAYLVHEGRQSAMLREIPYADSQKTETGKHPRSTSDHGCPEFPHHGTQGGPYGSKLEMCTLDTYESLSAAKTRILKANLEPPPVATQDPIASAEQTHRVRRRCKVEAEPLQSGP